MAVDDNLRGERGELIERLLQLLAEDHGQFRGWFYNNAIYVTLALGLPRPNREGDPSGWLAAARSRLLDMRSAGLWEPFIVRSVLHHLDQVYEAGADVGRWGKNRSDAREFFESLRHDPVAFEEFRRSAPEAWRATSWEEAQAEIDDFLSKLPPPLDADAAADAWGQRELWHARRDALLSNALIDRWERLNAADG